MAASNITDTTPWTKFFCNKDTVCAAGFECHYGSYCMPSVNLQGEPCLDAKDTVAPFVARVDNVYHLYCDMPTEIPPQNVTCPLGCEKWENCHGNLCMLKKCTKDQSLCKKGQVDMCMGLRKEEIFCYDSNPHGSTDPTSTAVPVPNNVTGGSSSEDKSNVGAIAGGVSAAVVVVLAIGAFFMVRRRRAAKAAKAAAAAQTLPTYSSQDEKNAMSQVA
ncbi:hypothetical protein K457DRAFT_122938 [Linnemannia elongata AG-77]|uniref:Uncharacterized protein n=1 Tax=Linnemannia elongata AG-77 TaxID=1314771 RepID=A0A197K515_9FUNG|nr:hypothetical protein K457DRAFT_122938 [Linnemannia elongata AG-77]